MTIRSVACRMAAVIALAAGAGASRLAAQVDAPLQVVVQVRDAAGHPVPGAEVALVSQVGQVPRSITTDSTGGAHFQRPGGTGEYVLTVRAHRFRPVRRRVAGAGESVLRVVFVLTEESTTTLATVRVRANRDSVERRFIYDAPPGNMEAATQGTDAVTPPTLATFEGQLRNNLLFDGVGGAGAAPGETQTQLNGLLFPGSALPRSAPVAIRGVVAEYDVSVAGFSGGRIAADLGAAGDYVSRTGSVVADATARDTRGNTGVPLGSVAPALTFDVGGTNLLMRERQGLAWGVRASATTTPNVALERVPAAFLDERGLSAERAAAIEAVAQPRGLGRSRDAEQWSRAMSGSAIARLDFDRRHARTNAVVAAASVDHRAPATIDPFATSRLATGLQVAQGTAQHLWERTDRHLAVWRARTGLVAEQSAVTTEGGDVTSVVAILPVDGAAANEWAPAVRLGGPLPPSRRDRLVLEQQLEREQRVGTRAEHQLKLFAQGRAHRLNERNDARQGFVDFAGLDAFRDASTALVRTTRYAPAEALAWRASLGVNDLWRLSSRLRAVGGVRMDWQRVDTRGRGAPQVLDLSPRIGVTWALIQPREAPGFVRTNLLSRQTGPSGVLRFGTGIFTGDFGPDDAVRPGGLPARVESVGCSLGGGPAGLGEGDAEALDAERLARACQAVMAARPLAGRGRLDDAFAPPRTWRTTAGISALLFGLDVTVDGVVSRTGRQARLVDAAVPRTAAASLASGRPFFASLDSVEPSTGILRPGRVGSTGPVSRDLEVSSALESSAERVVIGIGSPNGRSRWPFRLGYAWGRAVSTRGGWDADVDGSPWQVERRVAAWDRRHQLQLEIAHAFGRLDASLWLRVASGLPYTPLIAGDINGDGNAGNDRARREDLAALFGTEDGAPMPGGRAGRCLAGVTDAPGGASCRGPWSVNSALSLKMDLGSASRFPRARLQLAFENPASLLSPGLQRAGGQPVVDPVAARVRGYDPVARRFTLAPNPAFGARLPLGGAAAGLPRVMIAVEIPLAPTIREQQVDRWFIRRGLGDPLSVDSLAVLFARGVPNVMTGVLEREDELGLSVAQRTRIATLRDTLATALRRTWLDFAARMQRDAPSLSRAALMQRMQEVTDLAWDQSRVQANELARLLTPLQQSLLPPTAARLMRASAPVRIPVIYY